MHLSLTEILACPKCLGSLDCRSSSTAPDDVILEGTLHCQKCNNGFPITRGIPRFVSRENYADSFGYQWTVFRQEQIDAINATGLSARRFFSETDWKPEWMNGKWLLDGGCGAGRFLDVVGNTGARVVGVDLSAAVDAAAETVAEKTNAYLVQASIYELPFKPGTFAGVYSIGVIQHTPAPRLAITALAKLLEKNGRIAVTIYERKRWTLFNGKYLVRPITRRMNKKVLLFMIRIFMPLLFPLTELLFRLPVAGKIFRFMLPIANYVDEPALSTAQRYRWAVLDTFDMLSPAYDSPQTEEAMVAALRSAGVGEIRRLPNDGLNLVGVRAS